MKFYRALAVSEKVAQNIWNDKRIITLIILAPIIAMLLFGYSFGGTLHNAPIIVVNDDAGYKAPDSNSTVYISSLFLANLDINPDNVNYKILQMTSFGKAVQSVKNGDAYAAIFFPENLSRDVFVGLTNSTSNQGNSSAITVALDNSNIVGGDSTEGAVESAATLVQETLGVNVVLDRLNVENLFGNNIGFYDYFLPGVISFAVFLLPLILTLISFVDERTSGTLERVFSTPLTPGEMVLGYAIAFGLIGIIQSIVLIAVGIAAFQIIIAGNIFLALAIVAILALASQSFGILLSSLAKRQIQAVQLIPFIVLPGLLLTGILRPVQELPLWLQPLSFALPPTYAVNSLRDVMIKGSGISSVWTGVLALLIFSLIFLFMATIILNKRKA